MALGGEALALGGIASDARDGAARIEQALETGAAAECFGRMIAAQGGPSDFVDRWPDRLPAATVIREVLAPRAGFVQSIDGHRIGLAVVAMGGGRLIEGDRINPSVGFSEFAPLGSDLGAGEMICMVHAANEAAADHAEAAIHAAYVLGDQAPDMPDLIMEKVA